MTIIVSILHIRRWRQRVDKIKKKNLESLSARIGAQADCPRIPLDNHYTIYSTSWGWEETTGTCKTDLFWV